MGIIKYILIISVLLDVVGNDIGTDIINGIESSNVDNFLTPPNIDDVAQPEAPGKKRDIKKYNVILHNS